MPNQEAPELRADDPELMTPAEVTKALRIGAATLARWARATPPLIDSIELPGGHRRYRRSAVDAILNGSAARPASGEPDAA